MVAVGLLCAVPFAALGALAEGPLGQLADPDLTVDDADWPEVRPTFQITSGFFTNGAATPERRSAMTQVLRVESHDRISFFGSLGAVTLFEAGGEGGSHRTTRPANATFGGRAAVDLPWRLRAEVGLGTVLGFAHTAAGPERRISRSAFLHALAMEGAWDAWLWTASGVGVFLPARLARRHQLGRWPARLDLDAAVALTTARRGDGSTIEEPDPGRLAQAALGYSVSPLPWLCAGTRLQAVWMPTAPRFSVQAAVRPSLAVALGRWRVGTDLLIDIDEPYGWTGIGERIWALHLELGVWL